MSPENIVPFPTEPKPTHTAETNPHEFKTSRAGELIELPVVVHTPETDRECSILAASIDTQLERWTGLIGQSKRDSRVDLASHIAEDTAPLDREPVDYMSFAGFGGTMSREDAQLKTDYEKRRAIIAKWTQDPTIEKAEVSEQIQALAVYLDGFVQECEASKGLARSHKQMERYDTFIAAALSLRRILAVRERLSAETRKIPAITSHYFIQLVIKLNNDAF